MLSRMRSVLVVVVLIGVQSAAQAEDQSSGCGMGWKIAPKQSLISSTTRSYVNFTFSNSSGMTSGTSGCAKHSIVQKDKEAIYFAEANQGQLMIEMSQGQGENLRGLAAVMGCSDAGTVGFQKAIQKNFSVIFPTSDTTAAQMLNGVKSVVGSDQEVAAQCGFTG